MMQAGMGQIDPTLINRYIHRTYFRSDESLAVVLKIPGYGTCNGEVYRAKLLRYLQQSYTPSYPPVHLSIDHEQSHSFDTYLHEKINSEFFGGIMKDCIEEDAKELLLQL